MATNDAAHVNFPHTSWAVLAALSVEEEISGYDLKKSADRSFRHFYWSPSHSQVYSELKKLERHGFAKSRVDIDSNKRGRRLYWITPAGRSAVTAWFTEAPVDRPMLKHHVMLRVMFGHLSSPKRINEILRDHLADLDRLERIATVDAAVATSQPELVYSDIVLRWAKRHYAAQRTMTEQLINEINSAEAALADADHDAHCRYSHPTPGRWREIALRIEKGGR